MRHRHPIVAAIYDRFCAGEERAFLAALRQEVLGCARGTVIEIGAGTGLNFPHYRAGEIRILHAVEPDPYMLRRAEARAARADMTVEFCDSTAESLPFSAGYADAVVVTLVLCSVDEPARVVREMHRVLKPGGIVLFIEHVRSDQPARAWLQNWVTPIWRRIAANCHVNRATVRLLQESGFEVQEIRRIAGRGPWGSLIVAGTARTRPQGSLE